MAFLRMSTFTYIGASLASPRPMLARKIVFALLGAASVSLGACADGPADDEALLGDEDNEVRVDTRTPAARRQYDANVAFATSYRPTCAKTNSGRPRVLVTGFGRFMSINDNATGRIISKLVPGAVYPDTKSPAAGEVDPPGPQLNVVSTTLDLPQSGLVDVCSMILPVYWDLASILIAKEMESFQPSFVMMNGVAGERQPIWIELGATNRADALDDGSNQLRPAVAPSASFAKLVDGGEDARPNLLSWRAVEGAARVRIEKHAEDVDQNTRFGDVLQGVKLAGFPRSSNTYLCNNVTYVTGYLMGHPLSTVRLLRASPALRNQVNEVKVQMRTDFRNTPRVFVHWPSEMATKHHAAGADVMGSILDAQLVALSRGDRPTLGDNKIADPTLQGGKFF
jgi:pyrrolidone-carboxylate peptidase